MIQYPIDSALIRDHLYHDTNDITFVLNPNKFYHNGEFKSEKLYGLGYFNYQFQINEEIYKPNLADKLRGDIYDNFVKCLVILFIAMFIWACYFILNWQFVIGSLSKLPLLNRFIKRPYKYNDNYTYNVSHNDYRSDELEYHYIKA